MQNLEQIRARHVLLFANTQGASVSGDQGGEVIKKIPPIIMNHGLLAAMAFSFNEKEGWQLVFDAIARHLSSPAISIVPASVNDRNKLIGHLTSETTDSETLKRATSETMAWLEYARRFVRRG
jgi:CRISPR/Cas system CMR-associated protein Cmr5 small subunit